MKELEQRMDVESYYLPSFPIASASVNEFYGSIHFPMSTTYEVTCAVLESVCCMGFQNIVVVASHADPQHQIAIEKAVRRVNKKNGLSVIAPMGQIFMILGLTLVTLVMRYSPFYTYILLITYYLVKM